MERIITAPQIDLGLTVTDTGRVLARRAVSKRGGVLAVLAVTGVLGVGHLRSNHSEASTNQSPAVLLHKGDVITGDNAIQSLQNAGLTVNLISRPVEDSAIDGSQKPLEREQVTWAPETMKFWNKLIARWCNYFGVDPEVGMTIGTIESGGRPNASSGEAFGLWQIYPPTGRGIVNQLQIPSRYASESELNDPEVSTLMGAYYIYQQMKAFGVTDGSDENKSNPDEDWVKSTSIALAAYNGGPGSALNYQKTGHWLGTPAKQAETQRYYDYAIRLWVNRHNPAYKGDGLYQLWPAPGLVNAAAAELDRRAVSDPRYQNWRTKSFEPTLNPSDLIGNPDILAKFGR